MKPRDGEKQPLYAHVALLLEIPATWSEARGEWVLPPGAKDAAISLADKVNTFAQLTLGEMEKSGRPHNMTVTGAACVLERAEALDASTGGV